MDQPPVFTPPSTLSIQAIQPQNVIFSCGSGTVSISLKDGSVTFSGCTPDDGAKAFWKAVHGMFPGQVQPPQ